MTTTNYAAFTLALALGLSAAPGANAQLIDTSGAMRIETGTSIGAAGTGITADATASTSADLDVGNGAGPASTTASGESNTSLSFSFDKKGMKDGTEYSVSDATDVQTTAGLESYAASTVRDDERLESAALADGMLDVSYKTDAKFLGFIPASMRVHATVSAEGAVQVRYPWYAFLMAPYESRAELEARLTKEQGSIRDEIAEDASVRTGSSEARQWAFMLERLRSSLYAKSSAEARL